MNPSIDENVGQLLQSMQLFLADAMRTANAQGHLYDYDLKDLDEFEWIAQEFARLEKGDES